MYYVKYIISLNTIFYAVILPFFFIKGNNSHYFNVLWNKDLYVLRTNINNPVDYFLIIIILIGIGVFEILKETATDSFLYNDVYYLKTKRIEGFSKPELYSYLSLDLICKYLARIFGFSSSIAQFDLLIIIILSMVITNIVIVYVSTKDKIFTEKSTLAEKICCCIKNKGTLINKDDKDDIDEYEYETKESDDKNFGLEDIDEKK